MVHINYAGRHIYTVFLKEKAGIERNALWNIYGVVYRVHSGSEYGYCIAAVAKALAVIVVLKNKSSVKIVVEKGARLLGGEIYRIA